MISHAKPAEGVRFLTADVLGTLMHVDPRASHFYRKAPEKFDIIACQGNTFDFFLGPVQKALALFLFDQWLSKDGILIFTGHDFSKGDLKASRELPLQVAEKPLKIEYNLTWSGAYCRMDIRDEDGASKSWLPLHPTQFTWLKSFLEAMHYEQVQLDVDWFGPNGGNPYYLWAFRRVSPRDERRLTV